MLATVVMMVGPPSRAEHQEELAVFQDDGWGHRRERALAGADRVCGALDQAVDVGHAFLRR